MSALYSIESDPELTDNDAEGEDDNELSEDGEVVEDEDDDEDETMEVEDEDEEAEGDEDMELDTEDIKSEGEQLPSHDEVELHKRKKANSSATADKAAKDIVDQLVDLMKEKKTEMQRNARQKGGWEGWLQAELHTHLTKVNLMNYNVSREQPVFANGPIKKGKKKAGTQAIDLWLEPTNKKDPAIGIELKTASQGQEKGSPLWERLEEDIEKCVMGPADDRIEEHGLVVMICIGITYLVSDVEKMRASTKWGTIDVKKVNEDLLDTKREGFPEDAERALWIAWWSDSFDEDN